MRVDPNLPGTRTTRKLRWKKHDEKPDEERANAVSSPSSPLWPILMRNVVDGARLLVWLLAAALLIWVVLHARRWAARRGNPVARKPRAALPSHIGQLDIRPQSLPEDIGTSVAALWQRGEPRAALSLLYRGALSRLVHGPAAVPVRAASTEGECLALAQSRLAPPAYAFLARLVEVWQQAAYAGRLPETAQALALCAEFSTWLPAVSAVSDVSAASAVTATPAAATASAVTDTPAVTAASAVSAAPAVTAASAVSATPAVITESAVSAAPAVTTASAVTATPAVTTAFAVSAPATVTAPAATPVAAIPATTPAASSPKDAA